MIWSWRTKNIKKKNKIQSYSKSETEHGIPSLNLKLCSRVAGACIVLKLNVIRCWWHHLHLQNFNWQFDLHLNALRWEGLTDSWIQLELEEAHSTLESTKWLKWNLWKWLNQRAHCSAQSSLSSIVAHKYLCQCDDFILQNKYLRIYKDSFEVKNRGDWALKWQFIFKTNFSRACKV